MTSESTAIAKEITQHLKNLEKYRDLLTGEQIISVDHLKDFINEITLLSEKAAILKYLSGIPARSTENHISATITEEMSALPPAETPVSEPENAPSGKKSLYEKFSSGKPAESLADQLQKKLSASVSLHEKLLFQKELFGGNSAEFEDAILKTDNFKDIGDAKNYLEENYSKKYLWEKKNEALNKFYTLLERKFTV